MSPRKANSEKYLQYALSSSEVWNFHLKLTGGRGGKNQNDNFFLASVPLPLLLLFLNKYYTLYHVSNRAKKEEKKDLISVLPWRESMILQ